MFDRKLFFLYPAVALNRPAKTTSPARRALECPAFGGIEIVWVTADSTKSEVQQGQWTVVPDIEKVPLQGFLQCSRRVCLAIVLER